MAVSAPTFLTSYASDSTSVVSTSTQATGSTVAVGDMIIVVVASGRPNTALSVADSKSNIWLSGNPASTTNTPNSTVDVFYSKITNELSATDTITVNGDIYGQLGWTAHVVTGASGLVGANPVAQGASSSPETDLIVAAPGSLVVMGLATASASSLALNPQNSFSLLHDQVIEGPSGGRRTATFFRTTPIEQPLTPGVWMSGAHGWSAVSMEFLPEVSINDYNSFETGLTSGTAITGSNSGTGDAGTAFGSNFYQSSGATIAYDSAEVVHGDLASKIDLISSSGGASFGFNTSSSSALWSRGYFRLAATPNVNSTIHFIRDGATGNSGFSYRITNVSVLQFREHVNYTALANVAVLSSEVWYRLETYAAVDGYWQVWLYEQDSSTPLATYTGQVASTGATKFDLYRWGMEGSGVTNTMWIDDIAWSDSGKIGPSVQGGDQGGALYLKESFDLGADGAVIDASSAFFSSTYSATGTPSRFSSSRSVDGASSMRLNLNDGNSYNTINVGSQTVLWVSFYIFIQQAPTVNIGITYWSNGSSTVGQLMLMPGGMLRLWDQYTARWTSDVLADSQWHRVSIYIQPGSVTGHRLKIYSGDDLHSMSPSQDSGDQPATAASQSSVEGITFGVAQTATVDISFDRIEIDNSGEPNTLLASWNGNNGQPLPAISTGGVTVQSGGMRSPVIQVDSTEETRSVVYWDVGERSQGTVRAYFKTPTSWTGISVAIVQYSSGWQPVRARFALGGSGQPGQVRIIYGAGLQAYSANNVVETNTWYRVEFMLDQLVGRARFYLYAGDSDAVHHDSGWVLADYGDSYDQIRVGIDQNTGSSPYLLDDIKAVSGLGLIGPAGGEPEPDQPAEIALLGEASAEGYGSSLTVNYTSTAGSALMLFVRSTYGDNIVTDTAGNVWSLAADTIPSGADGQRAGQLYYCINAGPIVSLTINQSSGSHYLASLSEWSGVAGLRSAAAGLKSGGEHTVYAEEDDLIIGAYFRYHASVELNPTPSGYIGLTPVTRSSGGNVVGSAYAILTSSGGQGPIWDTPSNTGLTNAAFIPAESVGPVVGGSSMSIWDGSQRRSAKVSGVWDGAQIVEPKSYGYYDGSSYIKLWPKLIPESSINNTMFIGATYSSTIGDSSMSIVASSNIGSGDVALLFVDGMLDTADASVSGWTSLGQAVGAQNISSRLFARELSEADKGQTITVSLTNPNIRYVAHLLVYRGVNMPDIVAEWYLQGGDANTATPSLAASEGSTAVEHVAERANPTGENFTPPNGIVKRLDGGPNFAGVSVRAASADKKVTESGSVGGGTWTSTIATNHRVGWTVVLPGLS